MAFEITIHQLPINWFIVRRKKKFVEIPISCILVIGVEWQKNSTSESHDGTHFVNFFHSLHFRMR